MATLFLRGSHDCQVCWEMNIIDSFFPGCCVGPYGKLGRLFPSDASLAPTGQDSTIEPPTRALLHRQHHPLPLSLLHNVLSSRPRNGGSRSHRSPSADRQPHRRRLIPPARCRRKHHQSHADDGNRWSVRVRHTKHFDEAERGRLGSFHKDGGHGGHFWWVTKQRMNELGSLGKREFCADTSG